MDKNSLIVVILAFLMIIIMLIPGVGNTEKLIVMVASLFLIMFTRRGSIYYANANKKIMSKDPQKLPKAMELYKKALKAGVPTSYMITIGSLLIQNGEREAGAAALEKVIKKGSKNKKEVDDARIALSMAYWLQGDTPRAIELCEEAHESGGRSRNLYINLCTYYLEEKKVKEFHELVKEFKKDEKLKSPALTDLVAVDEYVAKNNWKGAALILKEMFDKRTYDFADPFVHMAQVKMHFGARKEALKYLEDCLEKCLFSETAIISKETVEKLITLLKDEKSAPSLMSANERDPLSLVNGKIPSLDSNIILSFETEPDYETLKEEVQKSEKKEEKSNKDESSVNTDLTDEDEEWAKKHGY